MSLQDLDIESAEQGLISTVCWVPKGSFSLAPKLTSQEEAKTAYEDMKKAEQAQAAQQNAQDDQDTVDDEDEVMKEFNMGKYDEEDDDFEVQMAKSLIDNPTLERVFAENQQDPAILQARDSDDEDEEDYSLAPTDRLLLAVNNEDFVSQMLVYVVEADNNLFVHHDLMLSNYGICIEWIGYMPLKPTPTKANLAAIGTLDPYIEIWNLDIVDAFEPVAVLGDPALGENNKAVPKKKKGPKKETHTGPVMSLSWNRQQQNFLASSSEDATVRLWDLNKAECVATYKHHTEKVSHVLFHPQQSNFLLSGADDHKCAFWDMRQSSTFQFYPLEKSDLQSMVFVPTNLNQFVVAMDNGMVQCHDIRKPNSKPLFSFKAHDSSIADLTFCEKMPDIVITCSEDKQLKYWRLKPNGIDLLAAQAMPTMPIVVRSTDNILAYAGEKGTLQIVNIEKKIEKLQK